MLHDILPELVPVVSVGVWLLLPQIKLEFTLGKGRSLEACVWSLYLSDFHRCLHGSVVNGLKDLGVDVDGFLALKGDPKDLEAVSQSLNSNSNGSVSHV